MRLLGIDLAWGEGTKTTPAGETGLVALDGSGAVLDAGWARGLDDTIAWILEVAAPDALAMVDAPLLVENESGQRLCETEVGRCYGRYKVSANSSNLKLASLAGVRLRERLEELGWLYDDGRSGQRRHGRLLYEVFPYTTIVGAEELGYDRERPAYKRRPKRVSPAEFRLERASTCDELLRRMDGLKRASTPLDLRSHAVTAALVQEPSPTFDRAYKHREDLLDAALCAWTGLVWYREGLARCQVLGLTGRAAPDATIIAPARAAQRVVTAGARDTKRS